jgi:hypothetical protein
MASLLNLCREGQALDGKMNRDHVTINLKFTRKDACQKFGYNRNEFILSET